MLQEQDTFSTYVTGLARDVAALANHTDITRVRQVSGIVAKMKAQLSDAQHKADVFNNREILFERPVTNYENVQQIVKQVSS